MTDHSPEDWESLALDAADTLVKAMTTTAWEAVKERIGSAVGSEQRMERDNEQLRVTSPADADARRAALVEVWKTRLLDMIEDDPARATALRAAMGANTPATAAVSAVTQTVNAAPYSSPTTYGGHHFEGNREVNVNSTVDKRRFFTLAPFFGFIQDHKTLSAVLAVAMAAGAVGGGALIAGGPSAGSGDSPTAGETLPAVQQSSSAPLATTSPTPEAPPAATAPEAGANLADVSGPGRLNVVANIAGRGFSIVDSILDISADPAVDQSTVQAYDVDGRPLAQLAPGSLTGECGAAEVINSKGRLLLTEKITNVPAAGLDAATYSLSLTASDATTGSPVWTSELVAPQGDVLNCTAFDGVLADLATTNDGAWGVFRRGVSQAGFVVDLTTGQRYARKDLIGTLGNYVVIGTDHTYYNGNPNTATMTVPGSWTKLGTFKTGSTEGGELPLDTSGNLAPTGTLGYRNNIWVAAATTPDGIRLIANLSGSVAAYSLPSGRRQWSMATPAFNTDILAAVSSSMVLILRRPNGVGSSTLLALDAATGHVAWKTKIDNGAHDGALCALTTTQVMVNVHDQLAILNAATGKQLSYDADPYKDINGYSRCPDVVATGLTGVGYEDGQVVQLLAP